MSLTKSLPPGPDSSQTEQAFRLFSKPYAFLEECERKYGDCFTLDFQGLGKHIFFSHPQAIQQIFSGSPEEYHAGDGQAVLRPFLGEFSLITLDETMHKQHRRMMTPAFQPQSLKGFSRIMQTTVINLMAKWEPGQVLSIQETMLDIALDVILGAVFGIGESKWLRSIKEALGECMSGFGSNPIPFINIKNTDSSPSKAKIQTAQQRFRKELFNKLSRIDKLIYAEIKRRRSCLDPSGEDALTLLISARNEDNLQLSDQEIRDELMTLIIAGHETTGSTLAWAFYWIHHNPRILELCLKELDNKDPSPASSPIPGLSYLDAIIKETLRICPVLPWVSRRLQSETEIQGWKLSSGIQVTACIYLTQHRKDLYPEPDSFRPERFLNRQFSPFEYYPFGGGARRCIGMYFAQAEMKLVLGYALRHFSFALEKEAKVRPVSRSVTVAPSGGLKMRILAKRKTK